MSGIKIENRILKGLPQNPTPLDEMRFLNQLTKWIPASARIKELFADEFIQWAKDTLAKERRNEPNPGMDGDLDIMGLWAMVNTERNTAIKNCADLKTDILATRVAADKRLNAEIKKQKIYPFPSITIHSGMPENKDVDYDLKDADEINLNLSRDATGTAFVVATKGRFPHPPPGTT
jgi:hypothetical protein